MSEFAVGEIAIFGNARCEHEYNGRECVVTGPYELRDYFDVRGAWGTDYGYTIEFADGEGCFAHQDQLRKKRPPREDMGSWDDIERITNGWRPRENSLNDNINRLTEKFESLLEQRYGRG